jgi:hypothetical protein
VDDQRIVVRFPAGAKNSLSVGFRPAAGSTQYLIDWVPARISTGLSGLGVNLTTHFHLTPMLRISGVIPTLPHIPS